MERGRQGRLVRIRLLRVVYKRERERVFKKWTPFLFMRRGA